MVIIIHRSSINSQLKGTYPRYQMHRQAVCLPTCTALPASYRHIGDSQLIDETMSPYPNLAIPTHIAPVWITPCAWLHFNLFSALGCLAGCTEHGVAQPPKAARRANRRATQAGHSRTRQADRQDRLTGCCGAFRLQTSLSQRFPPLAADPSPKAATKPSSEQASRAKLLCIRHVSLISRSSTQEPRMGVQIVQDPPSLCFPAKRRTMAVHPDVHRGSGMCRPMFWSVYIVYYLPTKL